MQRKRDNAASVRHCTKYYYHDYSHSYCYYSNNDNDDDDVDIIIIIIKYLASPVTGRRTESV